MFRRFELRPTKLILAIILMVVGAVSLYLTSRTDLQIAGSDFTSISILVSGLIFYAGILVIVSMFQNETLLAISLLMPSIIAVAIFVYGFIGWSIRVSLSKWKGLNPDYTFVGLDQYVKLFHDPRFIIDVRNTAMFTVGFILFCLLIGLSLAILLDQKLRGEAIFRGIFLFPMSISFIASGVVWGWLMNPATGNRITGINLIFQSLGLTSLISLWHSTPMPWGWPIPLFRQFGSFQVSPWRFTWAASAAFLRISVRPPGSMERVNSRSTGT